MDFLKLLDLGQTALELGLVNALTVLALFLSYSMLDIADLSTDGCFTLGAVVGAIVALAGHPLLSLPAAMLAGVCSGLATGLLQTRMGVQSLLAGIVVNTALYSVNMGISGNKAQLNLNRTQTIFTMAKSALADTPFAGQYRLLVELLIVALVLAGLTSFLSTRLGLSIRATGSNPDMVRSSSINPAMTTIVGLCLSGSLTALSGCLMAQQGKSYDINLGNGMVTVALASLLIGRSFFSRRSIPVRAIGAVAGAFLFRLIYAIALRLKMPGFMLKAVSSIIVVLAIAGPYLRAQAAITLRGLRRRQKGGCAC